MDCSLVEGSVVYCRVYFTINAFVLLNSQPWLILSLPVNIVLVILVFLNMVIGNLTLIPILYFIMFSPLSMLPRITTEQKVFSSLWVANAFSPLTLQSVGDGLNLYGFLHVIISFTPASQVKLKVLSFQCKQLQCSI